jgi:hypothetical protein
MGLMALLPLWRKCMLQIITHKNPPSLAGLEPAAASPIGSTLTTRPLRAAIYAVTYYIRTFPSAPLFPDILTFLR